MLDTICDLLDASPLGHERFLGAFGAFRSNMQDAEDVKGEVHNQFIFVAKPDQTIGAHPLHPIADLNRPGHDWIIKSLVEQYQIACGKTVHDSRGREGKLRFPHTNASLTQKLHVR